jgi:hypothetical protein
MRRVWYFAVLVLLVALVTKCSNDGGGSTGLDEQEDPSGFVCEYEPYIYGSPQDPLHKRAGSNNCRQGSDQSVYLLNRPGIAGDSIL